MRGKNAALWVAAALLGAGTFLVFLPSTAGEFVYDDNVYITTNQGLREGISFGSLRWALTDIHALNWHPLTWVSHLLDVQLYGFQPAGHHLTSVILHALATALLAVVLARMTGAVWPSVFTAILFGVHPLRVESVAWVAERKDVLSAFLMMAVLLGYHRWTRTRRPRDYVLVLVVYALGLTAKPMLVTVPAVWLLLDFWPLQRNSRESWRRLMMEKIPAVALAAVSAVLTIEAQSQGGAVKSSIEIPLWARVANAPVAASTYLRQMAWPTDLAALYPHPGTSVSVALAAAAGLLLLVLSAAAWRTRERSPWFLTGWGWYLITLLPVIGLVQVGDQAHADRYTYIPSAGVALAAVWGIRSLLARFRRRVPLLAAAGSTTAVLLSAATVIQIGYWRNDLVLYEQAIRVTSGNAMLWTNLGTEYDNRGLTDKAEAAYREALRIKPDHAIAISNLGIIFSRTGRGAEAVEQHLAALAIAPRYALGWYNLGIEYARQGLLSKAEQAYRQTVSLSPDFSDGHNNLGITLSLRGQNAEALEQLNISLRLDPDVPGTHFNTGLVLLSLGRRGEAAQRFRRALELDPGMRDARQQLEALVGE